MQSVLLWRSEIPGGSISSNQGWEPSRRCCRSLPPALAIPRLGVTLSTAIPAQTKGPRGVQHCSHHHRGSTHSDKCLKRTGPSEGPAKLPRVYPLQHRPCPCCTLLTQLVLAGRLICIPSSCRHRRHCSSRPPFISPSLRLQLCSCLTGPCVISAPTLLIACLSSQPRSSPFPRQHRLPDPSPSALSLHRDTPQPGERLQGAGGSPGSRIPDTPSLLWPAHTLAVGLGPQRFYLGPYNSGVVPMTGNKRRAFPSPHLPAPSRLAVPALPTVVVLVEGPQRGTRLGYLSVQQAINLNVRLMQTAERECDVAGSGAAAVRQRAPSQRGHYSAGKNDGKPRASACAGCLSGD